MTSYRKFKTKLLKDKKIQKAYKELEPEFILIQKIIKKRNEKGLTQEKLAQKIGTKQSAISRFESGSYNPSFSFLKKLAGAMGAELKISLIEQK